MFSTQLVASGKRRHLFVVCRFTTKEAWQDLLQGTMFKEFSAWFDASSIKAERAAHCYNETTHGFTRR